MKTLLLKHDYHEATKGEGASSSPSHVGLNQMIDDECVIVAPDGTIPAVLLKQRIPAALYEPAYELFNQR